MTALRERMINMVSGVAEDQIPRIILFVESIQKDTVKSQKESENRGRQAYQNLQKYRRRGTKDIDYKREIAKAIEEKYESVS